jgi:serine/threonine protein kinase
MSSKESLDQKEHISLRVTDAESVAGESAPGGASADRSKSSGEHSRSSAEHSISGASKAGPEEPGPPAEAPDFGGRFDVLELIGEGGMGLVYKVFDPALQKVFAVKVLKSVLASDKQALKRFEREAEAAIKLNHPNLVSIYEHSVLPDGTPFLVMDFIDGENLAQTIASNKRLDPARCLNIFQQIAEALEQVHAAGLVHRDVKPRNIILCKNEFGEETVKLVDFGIAKDASQPGATTVGVTQTGDFLGSPLYMSPEQCQGEELDARSDIYSAGCVLYEMLTGATPFASNNPVKIVIGHLNEKPTAPSLLTNESSCMAADLDAVVSRCLEKNPARRFSSAGELRSNLAAVTETSSPFQERSQLKSVFGFAMIAGIIAMVSLAYALPMLPFDLSGTLIDSFRPYAATVFAGDLVCFLSLTAVMTHLRTKGQLPQLNKMLMIPWLVSYGGLLPSYLSLPHVPVDSPFSTVYWIAYAGVSIAAVFMWSKYFAAPKTALSAAIGRIPTAQENENLALFRKCLLFSATWFFMFFKAPQTEGLSTLLPFICPLALLTAGSILCFKLARRLRNAQKIQAGDRWALLSLLSVITSFAAQLLGVTVQFMSGMFLLPYPQAQALANSASVGQMAAIVIAFVFGFVWLSRRNSMSHFGKTDGW